MKNIFNTVLQKQPDSSRFNLSHDVKMSFKMGCIVPTAIMEVLPGDKFNITPENFLRFAPLISPVMHRVRVTTHYFFVPTRILWDSWESWITGETGEVDLELPYVEFDEVIQGSIADYLGFPVGVYATSQRACILPIVAYLKIWNEYYRDQNLQNLINVVVLPGDNTAEYLQYLTQAPLKRAWEHDYFTAALPFAQKGDAVQIPLTVQNDIPVEYGYRGSSAANNVGLWRDANNGNAVSGVGNQQVFSGPVAPLGGGTVLNNGTPVAYDPNGTLTVDVQAGATDINTLRRAYRLQEWLEKNARGGTRYIENILAHFGIRSSDARLQRPEYIGGSKQNMVISEVLSTAQNDDSTVPVGQMAGHGISVGGGNNFKYSAEEHGYIIGLINVQPDTAYQDGLHRMWTRKSHLDYAWPSFANLGEQEVTRGELFARGANPSALFGYVPRYAEYKYMNSRVAGEMRSSLAFWHLGRIFNNEQELNEDFIECNPSTRIFAVTDPNEDHIFAHIFNSVSAVRKLPKYGVPTI